MLSELFGYSGPICITHSLLYLCHEYVELGLCESWVVYLSDPEHARTFVGVELSLGSIAENAVRTVDECRAGMGAPWRY